jgi:imidazole glycerol phosphate synthase subunit HisF
MPCAEKISAHLARARTPVADRRLARRFGSQCVVAGVDSQTTDRGYTVYQYTGDPEHHATPNALRRLGP